MAYVDALPCLSFSVSVSLLIYCKQNEVTLQESLDFMSGVGQSVRALRYCTHTKHTDTQYVAAMLTTKEMVCYATKGSLEIIYYELYVRLKGIEVAQYRLSFNFYLWCNIDYCRK